MRREYEVFLCVDGDGLEARPEQVAYLEKVLQEADIHVGVENNGIGPYEYGDTRGFDHGTDYLEVNDWDGITVRVLVHGVEPEERDGVVGGIGDLFAEVERERTIALAPQHDDGPCGKVEAVFNKRNEAAFGGGLAFTFDVEWEAGELEADL